MYTTESIMKELEDSGIETNDVYIIIKALQKMRYGTFMQYKEKYSYNELAMESMKNAEKLLVTRSGMFSDAHMNCYKMLDRER